MKIVQLLVSPEGERAHACLIALTEDGKVFQRPVRHVDAQWVELPALPTPQVPE